MRAEAEIDALMAEIRAALEVKAKRRLDQNRCRASIAMALALEWALGLGDRDQLMTLVNREVHDAVRHANRPGGAR